MPALVPPLSPYLSSFDLHPSANLKTLSAVTSTLAPAIWTLSSPQTQAHRKPSSPARSSSSKLSLLSISGSVSPSRERARDFSDVVRPSARTALQKAGLKHTSTPGVGGGERLGAGREEAQVARGAGCGGVERWEGSDECTEARLHPPADVHDGG